MAIIINNKLGAGSTLRLSCSGVNSPALANGQSWLPTQDDLNNIFHPLTSKPGSLSLSTPYYDNPGAASVILPSDDRAYDFELKVSPMPDDKAKAKKK
ncbi:MAG TPA: hypothetical protein VGS22_15175 [Thermoanaerobaculia bacterium]|jgi:hypothetical protein|nr:hypothetical protein [Thermoanaerobaculia bacterium]